MPFSRTPLKGMFNFSNGEREREREREKEKEKEKERERERERERMNDLFERAKSSKKVFAVHGLHCSARSGLQVKRDIGSLGNWGKRLLQLLLVCW